MANVHGIANCFIIFNEQNKLPDPKKVKKKILPRLRFEPWSGHDGVQCKLPSAAAPPIAAADNYVLGVKSANQCLRNHFKYALGPG
jgi:hypothetical protein